VKKAKIGVIALGNLLRQDDGVGSYFLEFLRRHLPQELQSEIEFLDGGRSGLELLSFIERQKKLLVLDAVNISAKAGEVIEWREENIPRYASGKLAILQMSFAEVLYWAHFTGGIPEEINVIGIQAKSIDCGSEFSQGSEQSLSDVLAKVLARLASWETGYPIKDS